MKSLMVYRSISAFPGDSADAACDRSIARIFKSSFRELSAAAHVER
jgi:hypothetical protein